MPASTPRLALSLASALSVAWPASALAQDSKTDPAASEAVKPGTKLPPKSDPSTTSGSSPATVIAPPTMPTLKTPLLVTKPLPLARPIVLGPATLTLPYRTTTARLGAVGSGHEVAIATFSPVRIRTSGLGAIGTGALATAAPFSPIRVRTAPMGAIGRPTGG